jgi:hypothetical protein
MFVTVVAIMCQLAVPLATIAPDRDCTAEETRVEEIVTDTDRDPEHLDFMSCMIHGQLGVAQWKIKHPIYFKDRWRVARTKCVPGHYELRGSV